MQWYSLIIIELKLTDILHKYLDDPSAEVTKYRLKLSFLCAVVLHEDPPATPSDAMDPGQSSTDKLKVHSFVNLYTFELINYNIDADIELAIKII